MSKNIINLTESQLLDIVSKVVAEQTANDVPVTVVGEFGQAQNKFSGLEKFVADMIAKINEQLQGETPYYIRRVKKGQNDGIASEFSKSSGNGFIIKVNLVPTTEEERHFRFTCAAAIFSEAVDYGSLANEVRIRASRKSNNFNSAQKYYLGSDYFDLKNFENLNPDAPKKEYKLLLFYFAGSTPPKFDK
jgi:hypothetical protein